MRELALFCRDSATQVAQITLVVKESQAKRMKYLCQHWLRRYDLDHIPVLTHTFLPEAKNWFLYEKLAYTKDWFAVNYGKEKERAA
jgi:hypothetical protein